MQQLPKTSGELWTILSALKPVEEIIPLVYNQLKRDFERSHLSLPFTEDRPTAEWITDLGNFIPAIGDEPLRQLLYIIDVPEQLTNASPGGHLLQLAEVILCRELLKVYFKLNYSA